MATIYDVARLAGVSPKTVSRVLNGAGPVHARTLTAVRAAITALNYVPSSAARTMRSQRSGLIGMITGAISTSAQAGPGGLPELFLVQGAQRILADRGMTLLIADTGGQVERVPELLRTFREHRVEGILYVAEYHREVQLPPAAGDVPVVLVNCFDAAGTPCVLPDDEAGQFALVDGLARRGHRRIGYLTMPEQQAAHPLRAAGYARGLAAHDIAYDDALVLTGALADAAREYAPLAEALDSLLRLADPPTVICCANDKMAMRVYGLLRERGLSVPGDICVAGYDDYRMIAEFLHPALATVELPYGAMGGRAADMLLRRLAGGVSEAGRELVSGPAIWRDSVGLRPGGASDVSDHR